MINQCSTCGRPISKCSKTCVKHSRSKRRVGYLEKAIEMRSKDAGYQEISKYLGVGYGTIYRALNK